jgi:trk system potassium uptake protein TrkH
VSATCVTGLIVVDTPSQFGPLGQAVLLGLMQTGGLGIMTFSAAAWLALGRRLSLRHEGAVAELVSAEDSRHLRNALWRILLVSFVSELGGAALLTLRFLMRGEPFGAALWRGVFTAVSAFCNAGFALQSDNLVSLQRDHLVIAAVGTLIVVGGLSPAAVVALPALVRRRRTALQVKLVVAATVVLLVGGAIGIAALEWGNALRDLTFAEKLHNAWFHSVTPRTAGFNSLPMEALRPPTLALTVALMFIGGSPGGTAGGIKTVTAAVLALAVAATFRGRPEASAFGRRIPHAMLYRAASITTVSLVVVGVATTLLLLTQPASSSALLFEVVSALGTVGLSVGATARLDAIGKVVIMLCMFVGRVGPLTMFFFLAGQRRTAHWQLPEEELEVG